MIRVVCFLLVAGSGCGIGWELRRRLRLRRDSLTMLRGILREIRSMICHCGMPPASMAAVLARRCPQNAFLAGLSRWTENVPFGEAWKQALQEAAPCLCLLPEDTAALSDCMEEVGRSDVEGAADRLELADDRLSALAAEAEERLQRDGKVLVTVGSACGLAVALLIL